MGECGESSSLEKETFHVLKANEPCIISLMGSLDFKVTSQPFRNNLERLRARQSGALIMVTIENSRLFLVACVLRKFSYTFKHKRKSM